jgi:hypothetical protein
LNMPDNHYVPCVALKNFAASDGQLYTYRILVSRPTVPLWKQSFPQAVAKQIHLYTRTAAGLATSEVEHWFSREFESPVKSALVKATSDAQLTSDDYYHLVRFLAAQDVRTPAALSSYLQRAKNTVPSVLQHSVEDALRDLEHAKKSGQPVARPKWPFSEYIPLRVETEIEPGQEFGKLKATVAVGRSLWLFSIRHSLTRTVEVLHEHRWTILKAPEDLPWFTSDDPVVRLNFRSEADYHFNGGWGSQGTEIFMPLSPQHLLYTTVGGRPPQRGTTLSREPARLIRRCIAEHAHRFIFAASADPEVANLRVRKVDADIFHQENEQWRRWHDEQSAAERDFPRR